MKLRVDVAYATAEAKPLRTATALEKLISQDQGGFSAARRSFSTLSARSKRRPSRSRSLGTHAIRMIVRTDHKVRWQTLLGRDRECIEGAHELSVAEPIGPDTIADDERRGLFLAVEGEFADNVPDRGMGF